MSRCPREFVLASPREFVLALRRGKTGVVVMERNMDESLIESVKKTIVFFKIRNVKPIVIAPEKKEQGWSAVLENM